MNKIDSDIMKPYATGLQAERPIKICLSRVEVEWELVVMVKRD